jgi:RNA polymerase sigma-70 factor (ECF subfamily)
MNSEAAGYFPRVVATAQEADRAEIHSPSDGSVETETVALSVSGMDQAVDTAATAHPGFDMSDEYLLARVADGEREALSTLFRRYATIIRVLAERIVRDASEAEDLVQEVFLFVFRKAGLFDPARGSARSWLVQVTYHRAFDRRRYLVSRRFYTNLELQEAILRAEEPGALTNSYDDSIEAALGRDALRRIDEALSEAQRLVIRLYFFDGHTLQEIAAVIGQSVGNVRNHYYRALEKIRKEVFTTKLQAK